jgi:hypothetical protein
MKLLMFFLFFYLSTYSQNQRVKVFVAIEMCMNDQQSFNFCNDGKDVIIKNRNIILSPNLTKKKIPLFYGDTILHINYDLISDSLYNSLFSFIDKNDSINIICLYSKSIKRKVNKYYKRINFNKKFDGKFYYKLAYLDVEIENYKKSEIQILENDTKKSFYKSLIFNTTNITRIYSFSYL